MLPAGFTVLKWRAATRAWMDARRDRLKFYGDDYWNFVLNWETSVITGLAMIAALSVLADSLQMNFEAVALCTVGSDYVEPIRRDNESPR